MLTNKKVIVRVKDIECPDAEIVLANLTADAELVGHIRFLSDGSQRSDEFAIVEASGLQAPLVVRIERLRAVDDQSTRDGETGDGRRVKQFYVI